jgi:hypothetical protein
MTTTADVHPVDEVPPARQLPPSGCSTLLFDHLPAKAGSGALAESAGLSVGGGQEAVEQPREESV